MTAVPLRHVADVRTSSVDKHTLAGETPVQLCNYVDVYKNDKVRPGDELMRATATAEEVSRFRLERGDSILTKDSEDPSDIGISAYVDGTADDLVCGYHLAIARPKTGSYPRYLTWALRSRPVLDHFSNHASGVSRFGLTTAGLRAAPMPWHEVEDQRRIADFLDDRVARIDQVITARRRQIALIDELNRSLSDELLIDVQEPWVRLGPFIRGIEQGWSPQCEAIEAQPQEWGVLKVGAVQPGWFDPSENKRLPDSEHPRSEYEVRPGDLLVSRANTPERVGFFAVVPPHVRPRLILCDKIMRIQVDSRFDPDFVAFVGQSRRTRDKLTLAGTGTSGSMVNIRGDDVRSMALPLLSDTRQRDLVRTWRQRSDELKGSKALLGSSIDLLAEYKQSLITAAVTGELDVTTAGRGIGG